MAIRTEKGRRYGGYKVIATAKRQVNRQGDGLPLTRERLARVGDYLINNNKSERITFKRQPVAKTVYRLKKPPRNLVTDVVVGGAKVVRATFGYGSLWARGLIAGLGKISEILIPDQREQEKHEAEIVIEEPPFLDFLDRRNSIASNQSNFSQAREDPPSLKKQPFLEMEYEDNEEEEQLPIPFSDEEVKMTPEAKKCHCACAVPEGPSESILDIENMIAVYKSLSGKQGFYPKINIPSLNKRKGEEQVGVLRVKRVCKHPSAETEQSIFQEEPLSKKLFGVAEVPTAATSLFGPSVDKKDETSKEKSSSLFGDTKEKPSSIFGNTESPSLFGDTPKDKPAEQQPASLFGVTSKPTTSTFGSPAEKPPVTTSLFGDTPKEAPATATTSLFGTTPKETPATANTSLFGDTSTEKPAATTSLFGTTPKEAPATANTSLFGDTSTEKPAATTSLFGTTPKETPATANTSLFGTTSIEKPSATSLFGDTPKESPATACTSLFGTTATEKPAATSLFGNTTENQTSIFGDKDKTALLEADKGSLFGSTETKPSLFSAPPAATSLFAPAADLFGSTPSAKPSTSSLFGGQLFPTTTTTTKTNTNSNLFGTTSTSSLFSANSTSSNAFGAPQTASNHNNGFAAAGNNNNGFGGQPFEQTNSFGGQNAFNKDAFASQASTAATEGFGGTQNSFAGNNNAFAANNNAFANTQSQNNFGNNSFGNGGTQDFGNSGATQPQAGNFGSPNDMKSTKRSVRIKRKFN